MNGLLADPLRLSLAPCDHGGSAAMGKREVSFEVTRWSEPELPPCLDMLVSESRAFRPRLGLRIPSDLDVSTFHRRRRSFASGVGGKSPFGDGGDHCQPVCG